LTEIFVCGILYIDSTYDKERLMLWIIFGSVVGALAIIAISLLIWGVVTRHDFIKIRKNVQQIFATLNICYKKRYDFVCKAVEIAQKNIDEKQLEKITAAMDLVNTAIREEDKDVRQVNLSKQIQDIYKLKNKKPLKDNTTFIEIVSQIEQIESDIVNARKYYNGLVKKYNFMRDSFPSSVVASINNFKKLSPLKDDEE
jgi:LemA protein